MTADDVLARHTKDQRPDFPNDCWECGASWGEDGCDAVVMAREVKRLLSEPRYTLEEWQAQINYGIMMAVHGPGGINETAALRRAALGAEGEKA